MKAYPPVGISYFQRGARHYFQRASPAQDIGGDLSPDNPYQHPHIGEFVSFGPGPQIVHTARWPVVGRQCWVTDMDDFGYPLLIGRYAAHPSLQTTELPWSSDLAATACQRARNMLSAYAHPSCKAIFFWTARALEDAEGWVDQLGLEKEAQGFLEKSRVLYPAEMPLLESIVERKWRPQESLKVLFVGNDYESKNGRVALHIFGRLSRRYPDVRFRYVGQVPSVDRSLAEAIDYRGPLPRRDVLRLFRESHILFHPTKAESFGMVLVEAAANGVATVVSRGPGLQHIEELVDNRHAVLVDRRAMASNAEGESFDEALCSLLEDPKKARNLALAAYERATRGRLSIDRRNSELLGAYCEAIAAPATSGFFLDDLSCRDDGAFSQMSSDDLAESREAFFKNQGLTEQRFFIESSKFTAQAISA